MLGAGSITFQNDDSEEDESESDEYMDNKALEDGTKPVDVTDKIVSFRLLIENVLTGKVQDEKDVDALDQKAKKGSVSLVVSRSYGLRARLTDRMRTETLRWVTAQETSRMQPRPNLPLSRNPTHLKRHRSARSAHLPFPHPSSSRPDREATRPVTPFAPKA